MKVRPSLLKAKWRNIRRSRAAKSEKVAIVYWSNLVPVTKKRSSKASENENTTLSACVSLLPCLPLHDSVSKARVAEIIVVYKTGESPPTESCMPESFTTRFDGLYVVHLLVYRRSSIESSLNAFVQYICRYNCVWGDINANIYRLSGWVFMGWWFGF